MNGLGGFLGGFRVGQVMSKPDPDFIGSGRAGRFLTRSPSGSVNKGPKPTRP